MAIELNDNIDILAPKKLDAREGPHSSIAEALANVPIAYRQQGLTLDILIGGDVIQYWFRGGIQDTDLIIKTSGSSSVESYPNFASFPATGKENVIYIDLFEEDSYYWNGTTYTLTSGGVVTVTDFTILPVTGNPANIYVTSNNNNTYYWDGSNYILTSSTSENIIQLDDLPQISNLTVLGNISGGLSNAQEITLNDNNTLSNASATTLATDGSIKSYVDTRVNYVADTEAVERNDEDDANFIRTIKPSQIVLNSSRTVSTEAQFKAINTLNTPLGVYFLFKADSDGLAYLYRLEAGTDNESSPSIIRPNDYVITTNEKVWKLAILGKSDNETINTIGNSFVDSTSIDFTYNEVNNQITADIIDGSIGPSKLTTAVKLTTSTVEFTPDLVTTQEIAIKKMSSISELTFINSSTVEISSLTFRTRLGGSTTYTTQTTFADVESAFNILATDEILYIEITATFNPAWNLSSQVLINYFY